MVDFSKEELELILYLLQVAWKAGVHDERVGYDFMNLKAKILDSMNPSKVEPPH